MAITVEELKVILTANTAEYTRALQGAQTELIKTGTNAKTAGSDSQEGASRMSKASNTIGGAVKSVALYATAFLTVSTAINSVKSAITDSSRAFLDFEDGAVGLIRSMNLTREEALELSTALFDIKTPTAIADLQEIARVAGQMGVARENTLEFVTAIDMIGVALGQDMGGDIGQITGELSKIASVFGLVDDQGRVTAEGITQIGSAINELGKTGVATAPFISDFTKRVGATANIFNMTLGEVTGLGAAFEELGLSSEVSATAVNTIFARMGKSLEEFGAVAGMSRDEFSALFESSPLEAFKAFASGVTEGQGSLEGITLALESAGISGGRIIQVLGALGSNVEGVDARIRIASDAIEENTSIQNEFAAATDTVSATQAELAKELERVKIENGEAVAEMNNAWAELKIEFTRNVLPALVSGFTTLSGAIMDVLTFSQTDFGKSIADNILLPLFESVGIIERRGRNLQEIEALRFAIEEIGTEAGLTSEQMRTVFENAIFSFQSFESAIVGSIGEMQGLKGEIIDAESYFETMGEASKIAFGQITPEIENARRQLSGMDSDARTVTDRFRGLRDAITGGLAPRLLQAQGVRGFESGGIVPGTSYSGDKVNIRANSGEMILNKSQQSNLFQMIQNGTSSNTSNRTMETKVEQNFYNTNVDPSAVANLLFFKLSTL